MGRSVRLFVAIDPDADTRALLTEELSLARRALQGWRWVRPEGVHLTLRFLGETDEDRVGELSEGLTRVAAHHAPLEIVLSGRWGAFPNARRPRVLWRGIEGDLEALAALARALERWARDAGYDAEERPFRAHLTLARAERRARQGPIELADLPGSAGDTFPVDAFALFRSELGPGGARYEPLARFPLGGGALDVEEPS